MTLRTGTAGAVVVLALATGGGLVASATPARGEVAFTAVASADSIRFVFDAAEFPTTRRPVDSAGPTSIATLSSSGGGTAYSAAPDPGTFLAAGPGLAAGVIGQNVPGGLPFAVPGYPLVAYADAQNPTQTIGAGGYKLDAAVGEDDATATTSTGATTPGANVVVTNAVARITSTAAKVEAVATSKTEGLSIGPLTFGLVQSRASVVSDATGALTKNSQFVVDGVRIGNIPVGLTPEGFSVAGNAVPNSDEALAQALAGAGITVAQFPQAATATGITGAGLLITQKLPFPTFGETTLTYRIGGVSANVEAFGSDPALVSIPSGATSGAAGGAAPAVGDIDQAGALPVTAPAVGGIAVPGVAPVPAQPTATVDLASRVLPIVPDIDGRSLYLALVLAGVLGAATMALIGARGVKRA